MLHTNHKADYEQFACIVFDCLVNSSKRCGINCPHTEIGIYCLRPENQIGQLSNGQIIFRYEVDVEQRTYINAATHRLTTERLNLENIENAIADTLPNYCRGGYYFTGHVTVWPIPNDRIRIEVAGVGRKQIMGGEILI